MYGCMDVCMCVGVYVCVYGYELLLGTRGTPAIYSKMHNICRLGMHIVLGPQSRQGNFA